MIQRFAVSLLSGVLITFSLLWVMQVLIATGKRAITDDADIMLGDFIRVKKEEIVRLDEDEPEKPPEVDDPPPEQPEAQTDDLDTSQSISIGGPSGKLDLGKLGGGRIGLGDGDFLPIVKVAPIYPRRAQTRGLEGQCLVSFTVDTTGAVKDAEIIECTSSLFERASKNAVLKFKYKPRVVDGVAQEVRNVQHIITFKLED
ncbi:MAG: energy transducer TonB [Gammaproteobacteria bacterium]|nr:energy transducer TonB [Gammaproteobacteria bacterium]NND54593.1 energy transducer TonB [Gammaproteobacteria bacterium]